VEGNRQRHIVGSPERVVTLLKQLIADTSADELMVTTMVYGVEERRRSYELLRAGWE
jgi:alkanesulfonate monooxygenase SsuD/methylene tetrahydromethanopterin reductase-like flavin-dependent oxidoreductase (luciferase family)